MKKHGRFEYVLAGKRLRGRATSISFTIDVGDVSDWDAWEKGMRDVANRPDVTHDADDAREDTFNVTITMGRTIRDFVALCELCDVRIKRVQRNV